jgi:hypothetical protein
MEKATPRPREMAIERTVERAIGREREMEMVTLWR